MTVFRALILLIGFAVTLPIALGISAWEWWQVWQKGLAPDLPKDWDREASFTDWGKIMDRRPK